MNIRWRTLEWWGCGVTLFLQTGAALSIFLPEFLCKLILMLAYAGTLALLLRHRGQFFIALRRNIPMALLLLLPFASVLWSASPRVTLIRSAALLLSLALAYLIAIRFTPRQLLVQVAGVLLVCMALSLLSMVALPGQARMPGESLMRGVFSHKNVLGWHAAISVFVCWVLIREHLVSRRLGSVFLGASLVCLVASGSMTAMFMLAVGLGLGWFYAALTRRRGLGRQLFVVLFVQFVVLALIGLTNYLVPLLDALGKDATLTGRVPLWHLEDAYIALRPIYGYGYEAFWSDTSAAGWQVRGAVGWEVPNAHNGYRETLLSFGLLGFAPLLWVIVVALRGGAAVHCAQPEVGWGWLNAYVGLFLVMNLTETGFFMPYNFMYILFVAAVVMFALRQPEAGLARSHDLPAVPAE